MGSFFSSFSSTPAPNKSTNKSSTNTTSTNKSPTSNKSPNSNKSPTSNKSPNKPPTQSGGSKYSHKGHYHRTKKAFTPLEI